MIPEPLPSIPIGARLDASLCIVDVFGQEYPSLVPILDKTDKKDIADWEAQRSSSSECEVLPLTDNTNDPM